MNNAPVDEAEYRRKIEYFARKKAEAIAELKKLGIDYPPTEPSDNEPTK